MINGKEEIINLRLKSQLITDRKFHNVQDVVEWMGAMQAQDYFASLWAIALRMPPSPSVNERLIEQAISERKIVRTWPMRGTLHFVPAKDARWMLRLLTPKVIHSNAARYRQLKLDQNVFNKCRNLLEVMLHGGNQCTRKDIYHKFENAGIATSGQRGIHIINHLAQTELICLGLKNKKQHTFVLLDEWIEEDNDYKKEEALYHLAKKYFESHGPATIHDFAVWSGLTITDAKKGIEMVKDNFISAFFDGERYWYAETLHQKTLKKITFNNWLLPPFDEIMCGYKKKDMVLDGPFIKNIMLKNGLIKAIVLYNGVAVGTWARTIKKDAVSMEVTLFYPINSDLRKSIEQQCENYSGFLEKNCELSFKEMLK